VQLENALLNLAINARDAMPDGGRLDIETANREIGPDERDGLPGGQYVMLAVTDSGTGMPDSVVERAFDPFFTTKGVGKGTGLGLSQIYGYVKQSGGAVKLDSVMGEGTRVELLFPRFAGPVSIASPPHEGDAMPAGSPASTILLVEDEDRVRQVAEEALRELGYTVVSVSGPRLALDALADAGEVDLLLTDVMMPEMSGRVLAEKAVGLRPGLKVLYMSGYTPDTEEKGVPGAMLLAKPFTLERLAQAVRTSIDR